MAKPCIFVSATTSDLGSYRKVAADALKRGGLDPICQERDFTPDYRPLPDFLRAEIDKCDAVICLVGFVYGGEPRTQSPEIQRSYTQWEYEFARELGKPTFIFLATEKCHFDSDVVQGDREEQLQLNYRESFVERFDNFDSYETLQRLIANAVPKIRESVAPEKVVMRMVERHLPTPLAQLFKKAYGSKSDPVALLNLTPLFYETLRFVALLVIEDSLAHGDYDSKSNTSGKVVAALTGVPNIDNWLELIRQVCISSNQKETCLIPELKGWWQTHLEKLESLRGHCDTITRALIIPGEAPPINSWENLRNGLVDIYKDLYFFRYYLFVAAGHDSLWLLRGTKPEVIKINLGAIGDCPPGEIFVLKPYDNKGLQLRPAFRCLIDTLPVPELTALNKAIYKNGQLQEIIFRGFYNNQNLTISDEQFISLFTSWLHAFDIKAEIKDSVPHAVFWKESFSEDSWQMLKTLSLPPDQLEIVGGRYCVEKPCTHTGTYANIFRANVVGTAGPPVAVHLLRSDQAENVHSQQWFKLRFKNWRKINHPSVLRPYDESDSESTSPSPYIVVDWVDSGKSLENELFQREELETDKVIEIVRMAAEVCRKAHDKGLRLLTFPSRHFLVKSDNKIFLTGFDTICPCREDCSKDAASNQPLNIWRRFPKDRLDFAPEIRTIRHFLPVSTDIFALGVLLNRLRNRRFHPLSRIDYSDNVDKRWNAFEFHCLAENPELRFQTVEQFLMFLNKWLNQSEDDPPETIEIPSGNVRIRTEGNEPKRYIDGFRIGKYPVTNAEYEVFCRATGYRLPNRCRLGSQDKITDDVRLSAPLCPVVGVSLEDAIAYCKWLSIETAEQWRLPRENEWIRAARLDTDFRFPWGDEMPNGRANYGLRFSGPTVVGAYPDGKSKGECLDMAGNVWEWCMDYAGPQNPKHILKGGAFDHTEAALSVKTNHQAVLNYRSINVGFRVLKEVGRR